MSDKQVGIVLSADYFAIHQMIELAPLIDRLGYAQVSVPEIWGHDAFSLLSVLAYRTKKVKLASGIVNIFSRSPATMAMTAASIDELSGGRFILGIGVSGPKVIEDWHGIPFQKPLTRTEEYVGILRSIFNRERMNYETSQLGTIKDFRISIREIRSDIPIHIAALGPKNIDLTTRIADGWLPVIMPLDDFREQVTTVKEKLKEKGKEDFAITPFVPTLVGTDEKTKATLKGHLAYYFGGMGDFYNNMLKRFGYEAEAEEIKKRWNGGDPKGAAAVIHDELLDEIAIHGDADHASEQLGRFQLAGATCPLLMIPFRSTWEQAMTTFQSLAPINEIA